MSEFDFILEPMRFSFSSASTYNGCPLAFKLSYIDAEPKSDNAFSDYGNLVHKTLEEFFKGNLEMWDLPEYYKENYPLYMTHDFPPYPQGMADNYYNAGLEFFENFDFDKEKYEVVDIEAMINAKIHDINLVVKPDLILKDKETGKYILYDYKTAKMKKSKKDLAKQLEEYMNQFQLYTYFYWLEKGIEISEIRIWFIREGVEHVETVDPVKVQDAIEWFENTIKAIRAEEEWLPNNSKENEYFCQHICSVRYMPDGITKRPCSSGV